MNEETVAEILQFLTKNLGYIKWGKEKLASKLECSVEEIVEAKRRIGVNYNNREEYYKLKEEAVKGIARVERDDITSMGGSTETLELNMPNILILDIETSPLKAYVWRLWKQDIYLDQLISEWFCLSWAAKWLNHPETMSEVLTPEEVKNENDGRIIKKLWNVLNDADIVICHNGNSFDIPRVRTRFLLNGLPPTSFYHQIDTKLIAAKEFGFSSNKLDSLLKHFNLPLKKSTDFNLWKDCMDGKEEALEYMEEYNRYDVEGLEQVYLVLRPWIKNHPNVTLYDDRLPNRCPSCGSSLLYKEDFYYTSIGKFQVHRCQKCGALSRDRKAVKRGIVTANLSLGR